jgi:hypothetical protein
MGITSTAIHRLAGMVLAASQLAGCGERRDVSLDGIVAAIEGGRLCTDLQRHFDAHRECLPVLFTNYASGLMRAGPGDPAAAALLSAGLILPVAPAPDGGRTFRPAPDAARWFVRERATPGADMTLCFGRRDITSLSASYDGKGWMLHYEFRLADPAPWLARPAIRAAFPRVAEAFNVRFVGPEQLVLRDGTFVPEQIAPAAAFPPYYAFGIGFRTQGPSSGKTTR